MNSETQDTQSPLKTSVAGSQRGRRLMGLVVVPIVVLIAVVVIYLQGGRYVETDNAYVKADKVSISAEVDGPVASIQVSENQQVATGEVLFYLATEPYDVAEKMAAATLATVVSELRALQASYAEMQAEIALANTRLAFTQRERKRQIDLAAQRFVSASVLDQAEQNEALAEQQVTALNQDLRRIAEQLGGDAQATINNHPRYLAAQAQLHQAQFNLAKTTVRASVAGVVVKLPKLGQYINAGNLAAVVVATDAPWIEANFTEADLTYVQAGQRVTIHVDTYPDDEWSGVVDSLSPATGAEFSIIPAQNATGNWVKVAQRLAVRISLDHDDTKPILRSGLSSAVVVDTEHRRSLFGWH